MITTSSVEFHRNLGQDRDKSMTEPVGVTWNGRGKVVLLSADAFRRLERRAREALPVGVSNCSDFAAIARRDGAAPQAFRPVN
jgi:PHD/YefM family antitoxin component YafN of YafNO toxin-antitoxin module